MRFKNRIVVLCLLLCSNFAWSSHSSSVQKFQNPIVFQPNTGQEEASIQYFAYGPGYKVLLSSSGAWLQFRNTDGGHAKIRIELESSNPDPILRQVGSAKTTMNYHTGSDPSKWKTNVPAYAAVIYKDIYPGIDWLFYESDGLLEYDFIVSAGADPSQIRINIAGDDGVTASQSDLIVTAQSAEFRMLAPVVFQCDGFVDGQCIGKHQEQKGEYERLADGRITFAIGSYDSRKTLIIDPKISFSTLLGGNTFDSANDVAVDTKGNFYVVGYTEANTRIPGNGDGFVHKFSPGGALIWTTFLAGSSGEDARSIAVNPAGICFVGGSTTSRDFPVANAFQSIFGGASDGYIVKLAPNGTIMQSSFLGGNAAEAINGVTLGKAPRHTNGLYIFGNTTSRNFPVKSAAQSKYGGGQQDGFVTIVHTKTFQHLMSTYIGGTGKDELRSIALNNSRGDIYGSVLSDEAQGPYFSQLKPKTANTLTHVAVSAPPDIDFEKGIYFLSAGTGIPAHILNQIKDFVLLADVLRILIDNSIVVNAEVSAEPLIVAAIDVCLPAATCSETSSLLFLDQNVNLKSSINFGGPNKGALFTNDMALARDGTLYIVGDTLSDSLPKVNAFQSTRKGGYEAFVYGVKPGTREVKLSSYIGGPGFDFALGVAVDGAGNVFVAGSTQSKNFPTTPNAPKKNPSGTGDGFVVKISQ